MIWVVVWRNAAATTSPALETTATFALPEPMSMASTYFNGEEEGICEFRSRLIESIDLMLARVPQNDRITENNPAVRLAHHGCRPRLPGVYRNAASVSDLSTSFHS
jgi:hypothetical protein